MQSDDAVNPDRLYDLVAVVIHCGSGPNRGHYISIVKSHGFWLLFDDDMVDVSIKKTRHSYSIVLNITIVFFLENRRIRNRRFLWTHVECAKVLRNGLYFVLPVQRL